MAASLIYNNLFMGKTIKKPTPLPAAPKVKQPRVSFVRQTPPVSFSAIPEDPIYHDDDDPKTTRSKQLRPRLRKAAPSSALLEVKIEEEDYLPHYSQDSDYSLE